MESVAAAAGTTVPTLRRRYPNKRSSPRSIETPGTMATTTTSEPCLTARSLWLSDRAPGSRR